MLCQTRQGSPERKPQRRSQQQHVRRQQEAPSSSSHRLPGETRFSWQRRWMDFRCSTCTPTWQQTGRSSLPPFLRTEWPCSSLTVSSKWMRRCRRPRSSLASRQLRRGFLRRCAKNGLRSSSGELRVAPGPMDCHCRLQSPWRRGGDRRRSGPLGRSCRSFRMRGRARRIRRRSREDDTRRSGLRATRLFGGRGLARRARCRKRLRCELQTERRPRRRGHRRRPSRWRHRPRRSQAMPN